MRKTLGVFILVLIWAASYYSGAVNGFLLPSPLEVFGKLLAPSSIGTYWIDVVQTVSRTLLGFFMSLFIGIPIGALLGIVPRYYQIWSMPLDFARSIPAVALFPLAILLFGIGDLAKVAIIVYAGSLILILQTYYGVVHGSKIRKELFHSMGVSKINTLWHLSFNEALPYIYAGSRLVASMALVLAIVSEMFIGSEYGLGKLIMDAQATYEISALYAYIILAGLIGYLMNKLLTSIGDRHVHWSGGVHD